MIALLFFASVAQCSDREPQQNFNCLQVCRVPYFQCIQTGIPGWDITSLQKCVIDLHSSGGIKDAKCNTCVKDTLVQEDCVGGSCIDEETEAPTPEPATVEFCGNFSKREKLCILPENTNGQCIWDADNRKCVPGKLPDSEGRTSLNTLQPCLKTCQEYALECNFTHAVNQKNVGEMRSCAYSLAEKALEGVVDHTGGHVSTLKDCMSCLKDIFVVLGSPLDPPEGGFTLFNDFRRWIEKQVTQKRCTEAGGKYKRNDMSKPGKCIQNKPHKLRCRKIKRMDICTAVGCNVKGAKKAKKAKKVNVQQKKCNGKNKWK